MLDSAKFIWKTWAPSYWKYRVVDPVTVKRSFESQKETRYVTLVLYGPQVCKHYVRYLFKERDRGKVAGSNFDHVVFTTSPSIDEWKVFTYKPRITFSTPTTARWGNMNTIMYNRCRINSFWDIYMQNSTMGYDDILQYTNLCLYEKHWNMSQNSFNHSWSHSSKGF